MAIGELDTLRPERLIAAHQERYGVAPTLVARAPGRINVIGEHTDYNDGFVLPAAIDRDTLIVATPRHDRRLRLRSLNLPGDADVDLDALAPAGAWHDYAVGVAAALQGAGYELRGLDATLESTVPVGAGLSSSAALEVAVAQVLTAAAGLTVPPRDLALLCRRAEHDFVGAQVGVMDQFISIFGQRDHALFLDCRTLETRAIPLALRDAGLMLVVCDSGVKHEIAAGEYNRRRAECAEAAEVLRGKYPDIVNLRDVTPAMLDAAQNLFGPGQQVSLRRARHVVTENARVEEVVAALSQGDWSGVGSALWASHNSLRLDYEVSVPEIDALVETAHSLPGVVGSRLMGGGFGGSTIILLQRDAVDMVAGALAARYRQHFGREAAIYPIEIVDGAQVERIA